MYRLLTRLYACLLLAYPRPFITVFREDMKVVFDRQLREMDTNRTTYLHRRWQMMGLLMKEIWDFPSTFMSALQFHSGSSGSNTTPAGAERRPVNSVNWTGTSGSWGEALLAGLPFLLHGVAYLLQGLDELGKLPGWPPVVIHYAPVGIYFLACAGLAAGWILRFPRWSLAWLGMAFYLASYYSNGRFYGVDFGWRAWVPFLGALLLGLLLSRSLRPLLTLIQSCWNDWSRLSFLLYAYMLPIFTIIFFDSDWGMSALYGLAVDSLLLGLGAAVYIRTRRILSRVVSLQSVMVIMVVKGLINNWYSPLRDDISLLAILTIPFFWGGLMFLPGVVGLLRRGLDSLSARRSV